jgi:hypothetical protein
VKNIWIVLYATTIIFLVPQAVEAEWVSVGSDKDGTEYLYDSGTMTKLPANIVEVWVKFQYSHEGRKKYIQERNSQGLDVDRYDTLSYSLTLEEVNCTTRQARTITFTNYSADSVMLLLISNKQQASEGWEPIQPESIGEKMYKAVCQ